jgi:hypothetical protein
MVSASVRKEAARGRALLEAYSEQLFQQQLEWRDARKREALTGMFPSCEPGDRGATSPLDGRSPGIWSGAPAKEQS